MNTYDEKISENGDRIRSFHRKLFD